MEHDFETELEILRYNIDSYLTAYEREEWGTCDTYDRKMHEIMTRARQFDKNHKSKFSTDILHDIYEIVEEGMRYEKSIRILCCVWRAIDLKLDEIRRQTK